MLIEFLYNISESTFTDYSGRNWRFLSCVTLKFDGWHWKTIGHHFYATSSSVHQFIAIVEFNLLQSRNSPYRSKLAIFMSHVTLQIDGWPWKKIGHLFMLRQALCFLLQPFVNLNWSYSPEKPKLGQNLLWPVTLTFDLFAWFLSMAITPENFMMIR